MRSWIARFTSAASAVQTQSQSLLVISSRIILSPSRRMLLRHRWAVRHRHSVILRPPHQVRLCPKKHPPSTGNHYKTAHNIIDGEEGALWQQVEKSMIAILMSAETEVDEE